MATFTYPPRRTDPSYLTAAGAGGYSTGQPSTLPQAPVQTTSARSGGQPQPAWTPDPNIPIYGDYRNQILTSMGASSDPQLKQIASNFGGPTQGQPRFSEDQWRDFAKRSNFSLQPQQQAPAAQPLPQQFPTAPIVPSLPTNPYEEVAKTAVPTSIGNADVGLNTGLAGIANQGYSSSPLMLTKAGDSNAFGKGTQNTMQSPMIAGEPNTMGGKLQRQQY